MQMTEQYNPIWSQKAKKLDLLKPKNMEGWWITPKLDGVGSITTINDIPQMYSISKAKVSGVFTNFSEKVPHIIEELGKFKYRGLLQGELIATHLPTCEENSGFASGTMHADNAVERQENGDYLKYVIYDMPSHTGTYEERYSALQQLFYGAGGLKYVSLIPIIGINNGNSWEDTFNTIVESDGEGLVLYDKTNIYKHSETTNPRNAGIIKVKAANEMEVLCVEKIEGKEGKCAGSLGSLRCIDKDGRDFRIGSFSITYAEKQYIWDHVECPFVCEMIYYMSTPSSYKVPRMTRYRPDKDIGTWNKDD